MASLPIASSAIRTRNTSASPRRKPKSQMTIHNKRRQALVVKTRQWDPFVVWVAGVSLYCIFTYLHVVSSRAVSKHISPTYYQNIRTGRIDTPEETDAQPSSNKVDIIHIIQTRFMQHQSSLLELGNARLALFEAFCLQSMLAQTNKNYVWIIRTDPNLHPSILERLMHLLERRQNIILLGSNSNMEGFGTVKKRSFQDFLLGENATRSTEMATPIWNGNITLLEDLYERSTDGALLLETRLDADDGLHREFVATLQSEARVSLGNRSIDADEVAWKIYCLNSNVEWHPLNPFSASEEESATKDETNQGYLIMYPNLLNVNGMCPTPGLTFGFAVGSGRSSLPEPLPHHKIVKSIDRCNESSDEVEVNCFTLLSALSPGAIRARTTTSAGMNNVVTGNEALDNKQHGIKRTRNNKRLAEQIHHQGQMWEQYQSIFSISYEQVRGVRSLLLDRSHEIAEDALTGQCSKGHSCKESAKKLLKQY